MVFLSFVPHYEYEARSYCLYFAFSAGALWTWLAPKGEGLSSLLVGLSFFCGMMVHYYFFICLVPFAIAECVNWRPWRFPSLRFISASGGIVTAGLLLLPEIAAEKAFNKVFWALPSLALLIHVYNEYFRSGLAVLVFAVLWLILVKRPRPGGEHPGPLEATRY